MAAGLFAIAPGYVACSVVGAFDAEAVVLLWVVATFYFWLRAITTGKDACTEAVLTAACHGALLVTWERHAFVTTVIAAHCVVLILSGGFSRQLYVAFCTYRILVHALAFTYRTIVAASGPPRPPSGSAVMELDTAIGLAALVLCQVALVSGVTGTQRASGSRGTAGAATPLDLAERSSTVSWNVLAAAGVVAVAAVGVQVLLLEHSMGAPSGAGVEATRPRPVAWVRTAVLTLLATVDDVANFGASGVHQPAAWSSLYYDLHVVAILAPVGCVRHCLRGTPSVTSVFLVVWCTVGLVCTAASVRLMVLLVPPACILAALAVTSLLETYDGHRITSTARVESGGTSKKKAQDLVAAIPMQRMGSWSALGLVGLLLVAYVHHATWVVREAYSMPAGIRTARHANGTRIVYDDFRETYSWMRHNTPADAAVLAWWDYGPQIAALARRTVFADDAHWDRTTVALTGTHVLWWMCGRVDALKRFLRLYGNALASLWLSVCVSVASLLQPHYMGQGLCEQRT